MNSFDFVRGGAMAMASPMIAILLTFSITACSGLSASPTDTVKPHGARKSELVRKVGTLDGDWGMPIRGAAWSPDGKTVALKINNKTIAVRDVKTNALIKELETALGSTNAASEPLRFTPNGRFLINAHDRARDNVVARVWDTSSWDLVREIVDEAPGGDSGMAMSDDGNTLIRVIPRFPLVPGDTFIVYDGTSFEIKWSMRTVPFYTRTVAISPDGLFAAVGGHVNNPKEWQSDLPIPRFGKPAEKNGFAVAIVDLEKQRVVRIARAGLSFETDHRLVWHPDGARISIVGGAGIETFDAFSGERIFTLADRYYRSEFSMRLAAHGKFVVRGIAYSDSRDGYLRVQSVNQPDLVQELALDVFSIASDPVNDRFIVGSTGKAIIYQINAR